MTQAPLHFSRRQFNLGMLGLLSGCASVQKSHGMPPPPSAPRTLPSVVLPPPGDNLRLAQLDPENFLNRITWGVNATAMAQLKSLGPDAYLDQQLRAHTAILPATVQAQIDAMTISTKPFVSMMADLATQRELAKEKKGVDDSLRKEYNQELTRIAKEAGSRFLLRTIHSPNQLQEQMTWFWMNHFNMHIGKNDVRAMLADFEEHAIRPYALGHFKDLLYSTVFHPAMLRYLDNEHNAVGHINENYARELLELHTLGVGSGYSQHDVQELARVLTGVGINFKAELPHMRPAIQKLYVRRNGFAFDPRRHDYDDKQFLGRTIHGRGLAELDEVLNMLCHQPATATFISRKLALFFVSDTPPDALIKKMQQTFLQTEGHIPSVLRTMFETPEFSASLGHKLKDPLHYVISSVRLAYDGDPIINAQALLGALNQLGQQLNGHQTPDGYALTDNAWDSPGQMTARFEFAHNLATGMPRLFRGEDQDRAEQVRQATISLADSAFVKQWLTSFSAATQAALRQAKSPQEWNALFLASPEMMHR